MADKPCPNCGHCPSCGRSNAKPTPHYGPYWVMPQPNTWISPTWRHPYTTYGQASSAGNSTNFQYYS